MTGGTSSSAIFSFLTSKSFIHSTGLKSRKNGQSSKTRMATLMHAMRLE
jgi:hypothetical protein